MDELIPLQKQIEDTRRKLNQLQERYMRLTGDRWHGVNTYVPYEFEFWFEEIFQIRFNFIKGSEGDNWTPPTPDEVEVVEILLANQPFSVDQHNEFVDWYGEDLTEACWMEFQEQKEEMI